jgi:hypothetical protein
MCPRVADPLIKHLFAALGRRGLRPATIELPDVVKITARWTTMTWNGSCEGLLPADPHDR